MTAINDILTNILEALRFDKEDFEEIPGRYFYNRGATYNQYLNLYWNDPQREIHRNSSQYDISAIHERGCTELVERFNNNQSGFRRFTNITTELSSLELMSLLTTRETVPLSKNRTAKTRTLPLNQRRLITS